MPSTHNESSVVAAVQNNVVVFDAILSSSGDRHCFPSNQLSRQYDRCHSADTAQQ